ncbi:triosephosphate isomerase [Gallibacterium salpingitidis]|uniref:Triosephosphate isomerase n=1 Tax=Gallibacterium salpingitidis TaxID=505341 RepID=A0AB36E4Y8_9PAST|nr:triose-phosphate isomerase [Gallibacterium salpingitidis]OBX06163.1 triosephosphate isomerase [Gallibacterium salpingitidis]OBX12049.1 triosephosphate isomerase [Gallibacterium salpingitidis]
MKSKIYFGTNLKMYKGNKDVIHYLSKLGDLYQKDVKSNNTELFVIPSYTTLSDATRLVKDELNNSIVIGAQNMCHADSGQFTGEISPLMLKELDVKLVMIGHSERRHIFRETDEEENKKVLSALKHKFITLLCIGETLEQKEFGISDEILRSQLKIGLNGVTTEQISLVRVAYEPVWAIGEHGIPASAEYAEEKHAVIKQCLYEMFGKEGLDIPVLYGGSVNPDNANKLINKEHIDGLFVGRSAWNAENFIDLIKDALKSLANNKDDNNEFGEIATKLIEYLGGKKNIVALTHCATRIRVVLNNPENIDKNKIEKLELVKGLFSITNQYQIIFGKDLVDIVYQKMQEQL